MANANHPHISDHNGIIARDFATKPHIGNTPSNATGPYSDRNSRLDFEVQVHIATYKSDYELSKHSGNTVGVLVHASTQLAAHGHPKSRPPAWQLRAAMQVDKDDEERKKARQRARARVTALAYGKHSEWQDMALARATAEQSSTKK